jgi:hypothetical protein
VQTVDCNPDEVGTGRRKGTSAHTEQIVGP